MLMTTEDLKTASAPNLLSQSTCAPTTRATVVVAARNQGQQILDQMLSKNYGLMIAFPFFR